MDSESWGAFDELLVALREVAGRFAGDEWGITAPDDQAEALRVLLHHVATGVDTQFEQDPAHPTFRPLVTPWRKTLGDNPDARYHDAPIDPAGVYRIRGRTGGAVYVSFTVEAGAGDGGFSTGTVGTLNDDGFDVAADGSFELWLGGPPRERGWLPLDPTASRVTVRHYWEDVAGPNRPPVADLALKIELVEGKVDSQPAAPTDATVSEALRRLARYVRSRTLEAMPPPGQGEPATFVSRIPHEFPPPVPPGEHGLAAADAAYSMAPYLLGPDEALVVDARWPTCRFANVVLWNRQLQTFDYLRAPVGLNRAQAVADADGRIQVVIAHEDPGVPNWLSTEGRPFGLVFWRFILAEGPIDTPVARVVPFAEITPP